MKQAVILSICGLQTYPGQEPERVELVTEGYLQQCQDGWELSYEESGLTGLEGVTTHFHISADKVTLTRTGKLNSKMVFCEGVAHESLYELEFGALMMRVCATKVKSDITAAGGTIDLIYNIEIEQTSAGVIEYHLKIRKK